MKPSSIPGIAARLLVLSGALLSLATAAPRFAVKIAGHDGSVIIPGDCTAPGYAGWINAHGFGQGMNRPAGETFIGTTGFTFHKAPDSASPRLLEAAATGKTLPAVIIHTLEERRDVAPVTVELRHVKVTGYQLGGGERPTEEITLVWSEVVLRYRSETDESCGTFATHESTADPRFDDDGDGLANHEDPDDDNDGIPDAYETGHGLDAFSDDAAGDLDADGHSNFDEAVADTRADDSGDFFRIDSLTYRQTAEGPQAVVALTVKPGRRYKLLATADLNSPRESWIVADEFEVAPHEAAGPTEIVLQGPLVANAGRLFFAAEVDRSEVER